VCGRWDVYLENVALFTGWEGKSGKVVNTIDKIWIGYSDKMVHTFEN
jgi:hypothetical protein